ncbi:L-sorbosone dehydrogenase [Shewanella colwelliana]|uniref:L-sorbosone dehydrogenase n=3 Tax=Shewanella colwelliana TaxID=23 RepID=A0A1E5IWN1_SHECO|nr:PQQ-dependent sugar dehydrogenase [Shewanella colwelliana]OEG74981.1 L-sorbosone dehydrogenase [Shewanella colwelliana]
MHKKTMSCRFSLALLSLMAMVFSASSSAQNQPIMITVTKGFGLSLYASDLGDAKQMAFGDKGTLFVGSHKSGTIQALVDANADGRVDKRYVIAKGLEYPEALAFHDGDLYVAEEDRIIRYVDIENRLRRPGRGKEVYDRLPGKTNKSHRSMRFGPDGRLYVAIGAPCNVCEAPAPFGSIIAIDIETGSSEQIATGIRNVTGFDWSPADGKLWFADLGRDWMGDRLPPDEINRVDTVGAHYGFPYIHATSVLEPAYEKPKGLKVTAPVFELPAHVAPMGLQFYRGQQFPQKYHQQLFVAENGSWNRSSKIGYQVVMLTLDGNTVTKRQTLVSFLDGEFPVARPYALLTGRDGALYISDDLKGNVYRLFYKDVIADESESSEQQDQDE